jgi:hypothetical protein
MIYKRQSVSFTNMLKLGLDLIFVWRPSEPFGTARRSPHKAKYFMKQSFPSLI